MSELLRWLRCLHRLCAPSASRGSFEACPSPPSHGGATSSGSGQSMSGKAAGPLRAEFARGFRLKRAHDPLGTDRHLIDAHADRVVHRVGDGRHDREQRALSHFLGAERPRRIGMLDEIGDDLRHVEARRTLVFQHRRELVDERVRQTRRQAAECLFFHQRLAQSHVDAAFDLSAHERRIERASHIVRNPHARHRRPARLGIHFHFDDGRGVRVGRRGADAAALELRGGLRRRVRPGRAERAEARFRHADRFLKRDARHRDCRDRRRAGRQRPDGSVRCPGARPRPRRSSRAHAPRPESRRCPSSA